MENRKIKIFDTTLRDGEQSPGCSMNIDEKVEVAVMLDKMGVDIIEAGFAASNIEDYEAIRRIASSVKNATVTSLARCVKSDIDIAAKALENASKKRIHVFIATSDDHMKLKLNKSREEVKKITKECVGYAKNLVDDIEFSLEDATSTDYDFACEIIDIAIDAGATTINIPDTVGQTTPEEFSEFITYLREHSNINNAVISVHCHNDYGLAVANSLAAVKVGATQVECTVNGIGERAGNTSMEEIVMILRKKQNIYNGYTDINPKFILPVSALVCDVTGSYVQANKAIVGMNAFSHEAGIHAQAPELYEKAVDKNELGITGSGIKLGKHSGVHGITIKMKEMGYDTSNYDVPSITSTVKRLAEETTVTDNDFITIIGECRNKQKAV